MNEYQAGAKKGKFPANAWKDLPLIQLTEQEAAWAKGLPPKLGVGERSCLAVALHRRGLLASDDLDARSVAKQNGIGLTGTLGILILCIERSYLTMAEGNEHLRELIDAGFRSPVRALDSFLKH